MFIEVKICSAFQHHVVGYCKVPLLTLLYLDKIDGYYDLCDVSGSSEKVGQVKLMVT